MDATRCPYCLAALRDPSSSASDSDEVVACFACDTAHHRACFEEHGACTIYGCKAARFRVVIKSERPGAPRARGVLGGLHPFLPVDAAPRRRGQRRPRAPGFLVVSPPALARPRLLERALRLELPGHAVTGRPLEGRLVVQAPAAVSGRGLRLRVESLLHGPGGLERIVRAEEAALVGGAARPWLERLLPWSRSRARVVPLVERGRTTFDLSLDVERLRWRGPLEGDGLGPAQSLRFTAELDGDPRERSAPVTLPVVEGRSRLAGLGEAEATTTAARAAALDDLDGGWTVGLVRAGPAGWPLGVAGVRRRGPVARGARVDAIDLALEPLEPGPPILRGVVTVALQRARLAGEVALALSVERLPWRGAAWTLHAREELVLAAGGEDAAGTHALAFEHALGLAFAPRGSDRRRVRAQAILRGAGLPLRSAERELVVTTPRPRRGPR